MLPKFRAGDLVWVQSLGDHVKPGEYPGQILSLEETRCSHGLCEYRVDIEGIPPPGPRPWLSCEKYLRPRRDDYQQHEPLGSRLDLNMPLLSLAVADMNLSEEQVKQLEELSK